MHGLKKIHIEMFIGSLAIYNLTQISNTTKLSHIDSKKRPNLDISNNYPTIVIYTKHFHWYIRKSTNNDDPYLNLLTLRENQDWIFLWITNMLLHSSEY